MDELRDRISLWFAVDYNRFYDEYGNIIHDMHNVLDPWQIEFIKKQQDSYCLLNGRNGELIEIFTPDVLESDAF